MSSVTCILNKDGCVVSGDAVSGGALCPGGPVLSGHARPPPHPLGLPQGSHRCSAGPSAGKVGAGHFIFQY